MIQIIFIFLDEHCIATALRELRPRACESVNKKHNFEATNRREKAMALECDSALQHLQLTIGSTDSGYEASPPEQQAEAEPTQNKQLKALRQTLL